MLFSSNSSVILICSLLTLSTTFHGNYNNWSHLVVIPYCVSYNIVSHQIKRGGKV